jgi:hypothetical protein
VSFQLSVNSCQLLVSSERSVVDRSNDLMFKTVVLFEVFDFLTFGFVSDFDFRVSDLYLFKLCILCGKYFKLVSIRGSKKINI